MKCQILTANSKKNVFFEKNKGNRRIFKESELPFSIKHKNQNTAEYKKEGKIV